MAARGGGATAGAQVHIVGLSIGGWTAMNLAVHRPQKIASLTLIEPVFVFARMAVEAIVRSIPASMPWLPKKMRDDFNSWTAGGAPVEDEPVGDMIEAGMITYRLKLPIPGSRPEPHHGVRVPTLVILAGRSPMHDTGRLPDARRLLRCGTVKRLRRRVSRDQRRASRRDRGRRGRAPRPIGR